MDSPGLNTVQHRIADLRRKPALVDAGLVLGLLVLTAAFTADWGGSAVLAAGSAPVRGGVWWLVTLVALTTLFVRGRWPAVTVVVGLLAALAHMTLGYGPTPVDVIGLIGLFAVTASRPLRFSLILLGVGVAAAGACSAYTYQLTAVSGVGTQVWGGFPVLAMALLLAWSAGRTAHVRKAYLTGLEQRAADLERERDTQAALAVAAERARISRELHDDVAHGLSIMVLQAQGGAAELDHRPDRTRQALAAIVDTGRRALADTRRLLGALGPDDADSHWSPPPGVERLPRLVEQIRAAGRSVDLRIDGEPGPLPSAVDVAGYRIVQEALTNTIKHAGAGATATVVLSYRPDALELEIADDGQGPQNQSTDHGGNGLRGMRERVAILGGAFQTGPAPNGGFRVHASLPLRSADQ